MFKTILSLIFLPIRILFQFFRILSWAIRKGDHFYLEIPSSFSFDKRSFFVRVLVGKEDSPFLLDFLLGLKALGTVPGLKKISFQISNPEYGFGEVWNLCRAIESLNEKGIHTSGYCLGGGTKAILLLSHCKSRYASSASEFFPVLPSAEPFFFGGTAKKLGVGVEAYASGAFKAFGETFQRNFLLSARKKEYRKPTLRPESSFRRRLSQEFRIGSKNLRGTDSKCGKTKEARISHGSFGRRRVRRKLSLRNV
ncbi:hypothetical protein [Leptospira wolffii]|uniref:hypothetical protein n=1 Tax=Leptospira wolffii TaxID=409998 RepID=UPI0002DC209A|nr:hypothetical protein [Leptospira wolffii]EPG66987.1 hypothetical protein LEP1GSC061_1946 [Leptospira wolffii serovar Khorat str. Khorat-H2]